MLIKANISIYIVHVDTIGCWQLDDGGLHGEPGLQLHASGLSGSAGPHGHQPGRGHHSVLRGQHRRRRHIHQRARYRYGRSILRGWIRLA